MRDPRILLTILVGASICAGCTIDLPDEGLLGRDSVTFVTKGEAESVEENGSCLVWLADDGRTFVLVQNARVKNEDFDALTTPGVRSRLELKTRPELGRPCRIGATVAEVTKVLEVEANGGAGTQSLAL